MQLEINNPRADDLPVQDSDSAGWMEAIKAGVLLGLMGYFVYNIISGDLSNYINLRFMWLSYVAVALFGLLGAVAVISLVRRDYNNITSDHTLIRWDIILMMALPLVMGTLIPSQPLGADAVRNNMSFQAGSFGVARIAEQDPLDRNLLDWARVFSEPGRDASAFDGQPADIIAFVITDPEYPADHVVLARAVVRCCVVDMEGIGIPMYWPEAATLRDDQWVRVQGTFTAGTFNYQRTPILQAESVETVDQPAQPYLYP